MGAHVRPAICSCLICISMFHVINKYGNAPPSSSVSHDRMEHFAIGGGVKRVGEMEGRLTGENRNKKTQTKEIQRVEN